ncbi:MAG: major capsid protein [Thiomicrorhabdus sp.]|jgi:hypothetical protein|nr:major capsid protein [Thiomicrorhabdus sp.]
MPITMQDTSTLVAVQNNIKPIGSYWLDLLFPSVQTFDTEFIDFDIVEGGRRLAPFVSPTVQGKVMTQNGYSTKRFTPAYVKPKNAVNPNQQFKRLAGEGISGTLSPAQRMNAAIGKNMLEEKNMILRRLEVMCAEAILDGSATVTGDNYASQVVSFGRDAGQTVVLAGGSQWGDAGVSIKDDIEGWVTQTQELSGYTPSRITVSPNVWNIMRKDAEIKADLDTNSRGSVASLDLGIGDGTAAQFKGMLSASLALFVYADVYEDDTGANVNIMPAGTVVLTSSGVEGVRCFGAIQDASALIPMEMFPKMWENQDPSVVYTMTQSAPLMVPTRPNASLKATVI